ncbi:hypothetical protein HO133_010616 [Letharia lupina]|uniref:mRNA stability protein n=1 Tax=Letharia lupina TaxID=560253 RepID=A0A8H6CIC5_9LECA|nr:uncharacterized protein HO133_010616 [Letharia lupina]KAF6224042.1 hypothetical protein HO133_010616 [Letharia lupina]
MNPHQKNKVDISSLNEEEQKLFRLYGKLPNKKDLLQNKLKERKYFDSGDYALSKAGKASEGGVTSIGSQHPLPENIPHLTSPGPNSGSNGNSNGASNGSIPGASSGSPVKESSFLQRETSVDEGSVLSPKSPERGSASSPPSKEGVPIRSQH